MDDKQLVRLDIEDGIGIITVDNPPMVDVKATLVDGQMSSVEVVPGRRCVYHWDAVTGWYGGCL